jgi:hypothetical protein
MDARLVRFIGALRAAANSNSAMLIEFFQLFACFYFASLQRSHILMPCDIG